MTNISFLNLDDKPVILVVLHHTFDPEAVVSDSSKFVDRKNTLTVDCLFYEDKGLLECKRNDKACEKAIEWLKSMVRYHFISMYFLTKVFFLTCMFTYGDMYNNVCVCVC